MTKDNQQIPVFKNVDEYYEFCKEMTKKYGRLIIGSEALKLKQQMDKIIPLPKIIPR